MTKKLVEVNTIYAQMSELSNHSFRPHPWVMGFVYGQDGAVSVWWDHAYESSKYQLAKFDLVDWMHESNFVADTMANLIPLPEEKNLIMPGLMITWNPIGKEAKISKMAKQYIERLQNVT